MSSLFSIVWLVFAWCMAMLLTVSVHHSSLLMLVVSVAWIFLFRLMYKKKVFFANLLSVVFILIIKFFRDGLEGLTSFYEDTFSFLHSLLLECGGIVISVFLVLYIFYNLIVDTPLQRLEKNLRAKLNVRGLDEEAIEKIVVPIMDNAQKDETQLRKQLRKRGVKSSQIEDEVETLMQRYENSV